MSLIITEGWTWFCIAFGIILLTRYFMSLQEKHFYTMDVVERKFTIIDLQFAANVKELAIMIKGMFGLPADKKEQAIRSLKGQLYVDFLFMPAAYCGIFILCMQVSNKLTLPVGKLVFVVFAWSQLLAWLCDFFENMYLLNKIRPDIIIPKDIVTINQEKTIPKNRVFAMYRLLVFLKWGIALIGGVCSIFALIYFWITGDYEKNSLQYLLILGGEVILFIVADKLSAKKEVKEVES